MMYAVVYINNIEVGVYHMSKWSDRIPVAFPKEMLTDANQLASIIDPDTGGASTFSLDNTKGEIPFMEHFVPIIRDRDVTTWKTVVADLATEKGVEPLSPEIIESLCNAMLFGQECQNLGENNEFI